MFDAAWLNVGSLMLGLVAWVIPIVNFLGDKELKEKRWIVLTIGSFSACSIALCFQMLYNYNLVKIGDWSALMDTIGAVVFASITLVIVTIVLNAFALIYRERTAMQDKGISLTEEKI